MFHDASQPSSPTSSIDRAIERRSQPDWLHAQLSGSAQVLPLWRGHNLFHVNNEKGPLYLDSRTVQASLDTVFLGVRSNGKALFAADVSGVEDEEEALRVFNLTTDQGRFFQLREFKGSLTPQDRAVESSWSTVRGSDSGAKPFRRTSFCLCSFFISILRRRICRERNEKTR